MSTAISKVYSWSMQAGLQEMVMMDRLWGNSIIDPSLKASPYLCLGMPLARLEAEAALNQLLDRYPELTLPEQDFVWSDSPFFRGIEQLTVRGT